LDTIAPISSLKVHDKAHHSGVRLSVILPENTQTEMAGQFDKFHYNHVAERRLKKAGQFNNACEMKERIGT